MSRTPDARDAAEFQESLVAGMRREPRFAWMLQTFGLDQVDAAVLAIAVAVELDPSLGRMLVGLTAREGGLTANACMELIAADVAQRLALRRRFTAEHPLFAHRLLTATSRVAGDIDPSRSGAIGVDPQVLAVLLYESGLDPRLTRYCRLIEPGGADSPPLAPRRWEKLLAMARHAQDSHSALHLQFHGERGSGRRHSAEALAAALGLKLLVADAALVAGATDCAELLAPVFRQAWFSDAVLYVEGIDSLSRSASGIELERFLDDIAQDSGITIVATPAQWNPGPRRLPVFTAIKFGNVDRAGRKMLWERGLAARDIEGLDVAVVAERFRLTPGQIESAIVHAQRQAHGTGRASLTADDLISAARSQAPIDLSQLARKVTPAARWDDLVLPADASRQLRELCARVTQRTRVLDDWGFDAKLSLGKGSSALFAGASGTGKTMAAEIVAAELGLDLYKIDLAGIVS